VGAPLLIIAGYGSTWNGLGDHPIPGPFLEERFSYRGLAGDGRPMGYRSGDTVKTLPVLDRMVATQVNDLRAHTGRDVAIVAESEGALIAETYLAATPSAPVNRVVFASPLLVPGLASYPTGAAEGWGVASAGLMKLLAGALRSTSPIDISPASAFMRSVDAEGTVIRRLSACPLAAYHPVALVALADTVGIPPRQAVGFPVEIMPSFHGGMIADSALDARIRTILMGRAPEQKTGWDRVGNLVQAAATAWQVPTLAATLAPQPHGAAPAAGTSRATRVCARIDAQLRALIWGTGAVR
jgi:hypothetical protein